MNRDTQNGKTHIAVFIPVEPALHVVIADQLLGCIKQTQESLKKETKWEVTWILDTETPPEALVIRPKTLSSRVERNSHIRNLMLEKHWDEKYDYIFWIDADVEWHPMVFEFLIYKAIENKGTDILAPSVLLMGEDQRFYDIAGFIHEGRWMNIYPPYISKENTSTLHQTKMDSVGAFYIVPSFLYSWGARYAPHKEYTEHYSVCQFAIKHGFNVYWLSNLAVFHFNFSKIGLRNH